MPWVAAVLWSVFRRSISQTAEFWSTCWHNATRSPEGIIVCRGERSLIRHRAARTPPPVTSVLLAYITDVFAKDFKFVRDLGQATDLREANASAADFQNANAARRKF